MFVMLRIIFMNYLKILLFKFVDICDFFIVYFVDWDLEFFYIILYFYRVGVCNVLIYLIIYCKF